MRNLVPIDLKITTLYLMKLLHIIAIVLESQSVCLEVEADGEVPSILGPELLWLFCKLLLAQRLVFYQLLHIAIDLYYNIFVAYSFAQFDFEIDIRSVAVYQAEV